MGHARIVLSGMCPRLQGLQWETDTLLRIGRQGNVDIRLDDPTVSRAHAEILTTGSRWLVRDLAHHDHYPTLLNGTRVGTGGCALQLHDLVQCGALVFQVTRLEVASRPIVPQVAPQPPAVSDAVRTTGSFVRIQAATQHTWDQAVEAVAHGAAADPRRDQHLLTLLRAGHHLSHLASLDDLVRSVLEDAVGALKCQRGSILLEDPVIGELRLRQVLAPELPVQRCYSRTLAERCFRQGESLLCRDASAEADLALAGSVRRGAMATLICALLRSPRKRIGVLQIDRGPGQDPFDQHDFHLADAIGATVAVGIESAQLVEQQREQFIQTVTSLARTVEVRDPYTYGHARRVTDYALLLAEELHVGTAERHQIQVGGPLHDIGKIGVEDAVLRKPGRLSDSEFEQMRQHPALGAAILESVTSLGPMLAIVRHHHERWDGSGYPDRLARDRIDPTARIVAVADAFDAMTSNRPYRTSMPAERAFTELHDKAGTHFDPECVRGFLRIRAYIEAMLRQK